MAKTSKLQIILGMKDNASKKLGRVEKKVLLTASNIRRAGLALVAFGAAGTLAIGKMSKDVIDMSSDLVRLSEATGIAATQIGGLGFAAEQEGGSLEAVAKALKKLTDASRLAGQSLNNESRRAFEALGITANKTDGSLKSSQELLFDLADTLSKGTITNEKYAAANFLMGRAAQSLIPFLKGGTREIKSQINAYLELTGITDDMLDRFKLAGDELTTLKTAFLGLTIQVASAALPAIRKLVEITLRLIKAFQELPNSTKETIVAMGVIAPIVIAATGALLLFAVAIKSAGLFIVATIGSFLSFTQTFTRLGTIVAKTTELYLRFKRATGSAVSDSDIARVKKLGDALFTISQKGVAFGGVKVIKDLLKDLKLPKLDLAKVTKDIQKSIMEAFGKGGADGVKSLTKSSFGVGEFLPTFGSLTGGSLFSRSLKQNNITINVDPQSDFGKQVMQFISSQGALAI